jgi:hypothetical protein
VNVRILACAWVALVLCACDSDRVAGGSVETENVSARVLPVDSILPEWNRPESGATVATLRFDSANFDFSKSSSDGSDLRMERLDGTLLPFEVVFWDPSVRMGRLRVRLDGALLSTRKSIRFRWGLSNAASLSDPTSTWAGLDSLRSVLTSVSVADFENGSDTTLLPTHPLWNAYNADSSYVDSFGFPADNPGRPGKAMHMRCRAPGTHFVVVNTELVKGGAVRSLRALDSMVLWVKGTGTLSVSFDHLTYGFGPKAWMHFTLGPTWTRLRVRPQDLDPADYVGYNLGWNAVRDSITHLTFIVSGGTELWMDDVRLHGVDRDDLR